MYLLPALLAALFLAPAAARVPAAKFDTANGPQVPQVPIALAPAHDELARVPVVLGVMSRCPDALVCESIFDGVLRQTWDIVSISLSFIGKIDAAEREFGVTCMHGVAECRGNVQELCAMHVARTPQDWWHFVQCLNFEGREDVGDRALAERCAGLSYVPWGAETYPYGGHGNASYGSGGGGGGIRGCVDGGEGKALLQASVRQTQRLGIEKSCTIMISGKPRCIHDGTWKECETGHTVEEIVSYLRAEHRKLNGLAIPLEDEDE